MPNAENDAAWWRRAAELSPDPIAFADARSTLRWVNAAFARLLGYPVGELEGRRWRDITHPQDLAGAADSHGKLRKELVADYYLEQRYQRRDGEYVACAVLVHRHPASGPYGGAIVFVRSLADQAGFAELRQEFDTLRQEVQAMRSNNRAPQVDVHVGDSIRAGGDVTNRSHIRNAQRAVVALIVAIGAVASAISYWIYAQRSADPAPPAVERPE